VIRGRVRQAADLLRRARPDADAKPPGDRTILDDLAMRRPWNVRVKAERARARLRLSRLTPGVTVVVVNWNTADLTADVVTAVQALSPPDTRILLIDNGSTDHSRNRFADWPGIDTLFLRNNAGHGVALDIGVCRVRTTIAVTLDSDAIPLRTGWLDLAVEPVRSGDAALAGSASRRGFVHPIYLAISAERFVRDRRASFQVHVEPSVRNDPDAESNWGVDSFDTAELLSTRFTDAEKVLIPKAPNPAPDLPGMTVADVVYHHGGVTRSAGGVLTPEAHAQWRDACDAIGLGDIVRG
jgi:hypothetical protein